MSTVESYELIRSAWRDDGLLIRELAVRFRVHRRDVRLAINAESPPPRVAPSIRRARPLLGLPIIVVLFFESVVRDHSKDRPMVVA